MDTVASQSHCPNRKKTQILSTSSKLSTSVFEADLVVVGIINYSSGYGIDTCRKICGLLDLGYEVFVRPIHFDGSSNSGVPHVIHERIIKGSGHMVPWELLMAPPRYICPTPGKKTVLYTTLETDSVPEGFAEMAMRCEAIIVPCSWNRDAIRKAGIPTRVFVARESVDEGFYRKRHKCNPRFVFGSVAKTFNHDGGRKGLSVMVNAFRSAFSPNDDSVRLRIKIGAKDPDVETFGDARIEVNRDRFTTDQMIDWMHAIDCYVNASSGEAWCRPLHEAMASGLLVITAMYGGVKEYARPELCLQVDYQVSAGSGGYSFGSWAELDQDSMASQMRSARCMMNYRRKWYGALLRANAQTFSSRFEASIMEAHLISLGALTQKHKPKLRLRRNGSPADLIVGFYRNRAKSPKPAGPPIEKNNLTNTPGGIGDILVMTAVGMQFMQAEAKNRIWHKANAFKQLLHLLPSATEKMPTRLKSAYEINRLYCCGNGHFTQRLSRMFGFEPETIPQPRLLISPAIKKPNKVIIHLNPGKHVQWQRGVIHPRAREVYPSTITMLEDFIKDHPSYDFVEVGAERHLANARHVATDLLELVQEIAEAGWFIGIMSGPMHIAAAFGLRSIILINFPHANQIFLPTLKDIPQVESEWFYPQNVHLHQDNTGPLVPKCSEKTLRQAFNGEIYPFWTTDYCGLIHEQI